MAIRTLSEHLRLFWARLRHRFDATASGAGGPLDCGNSSGIRIVALLASQRDREILSRAAGKHSWSVYPAATCGEAWDLLKQSRAPIILCDRELPATEWRDVIQMMVACDQHPYAILVSRVADDYLWNEVIRHGGHDLLATPLREDDLVRAVRLAWSYWNSSLKAQPMLIKHYL